MIKYGFNFDTLYCIELDALYDIVRTIREGEATIAPDKDVIIRGCIIPFLRNAAKAPEDTDKDEVMRLALIAAAKKLGLRFKDWNAINADDLALVTLRQVQKLVSERLDKLDPKQRGQVLGIANNNLKELAKTMGGPLVGASALVAGEMSGIGIYLATTTGLHALSLALGTTFSWGVYQGATALLGIVLGPIGWAIAGLSVAGSTVIAVRNWAAGKKERRLILTVIALLLAIGENPFQFFGLLSDAPLDEVKKVDRAIAKKFHPDTVDQNLPQWIRDDLAEKWLRYQEARAKLYRIREGCKKNERNSNCEK